MEEKKKTGRKKHWKVKRKKKKRNIRKVKWQQYTSLVSNDILLENVIWKKVVYTIKFYLQFLFVEGYLKHSNDAPNLNIHSASSFPARLFTIRGSNF